MTSQTQPNPRYRNRAAPALAWALCVLTVVLLIGFSLLFVAATTSTYVVATLNLTVVDKVGAFFDILPLLAISAIGAFIISRHPENWIGWIFCALGFLSAIEEFAAIYAIYALFVEPGSLPGGLAAAWVQNWIWVVHYGLSGIFLPLLFPNGRLLSKRWRVLAWLGVILMALMTFSVAFHAGPLFNALEPFNVSNPFGFIEVDDTFQAVAQVSFLLLNAAVLASALSLIPRLRRATGDERRQIKWFAYFIALGGVLLVIQALVRYILQISTPSFEVAFSIAALIQTTGLPIATGLAILKYHLYDIDILINRTLVYGVLTSTLALIYFGSVVLLQGLFRTLTGHAAQSQLAIVASTLAIAALFNPLRRRIQELIDRRFYRRKYDAVKTLAAFSATLHDEVDLDRLTAELLRVVEETMQPAHVSLWLPPVPERGGSRNVNDR